MTDALFDVPSPRHCESGCWYCQDTNPKQAGQWAALVNVAETWYDAADRWIMRQPKGTRFTSEQLTAAVGKPNSQAQHKNNAVGAFIGAQARMGRIKSVGYVKSQNRESHSAVINEWVKL